jgi:hypothetical protein
VHNVNDVRRVEIHAVEPLVPGLSHLEVEISISKLMRHHQVVNKFLQN